MSVTTTQNDLYYETAALLRHYDVHHTGDEPHNPTLNEHPLPDGTNVSNPPQWPSQHRRIPPMRPVNTNLDFNERGTRNLPETIFVFVMLQGVRTVSGVAKSWGVTGGKLHETLFRYAVGGEY